MAREGQEFLFGFTLNTEQVEITDVDDGELSFDPAMSGLSGGLTEPELNDRIEQRASDIHAGRSSESRIADNAKRAELADDPLQWATRPGRFDLKGIDTPAAHEDDGFDTPDFDGAEFLRNR
jgi:hypothetical protein